MIRRKYDYYLHRSGGYLYDYFGYVGPPFRVSPIRWFLWKWMGYRATRVTRGASLRRVMIRATLKRGAHRRSYAMERIKKGDYGYDHS